MDKKTFVAAIITIAFLVSTVATSTILVSAQSASSSTAPTVEWEHTYSTGESGFSGINSMIQTSDGGYALAGSAMALILGDIGPWLIKTDSTGNHQWSKFYFSDQMNVNLPGANAVVQTSDGGFALAGGPYLVKADSQGTMQWRQTFPVARLWSLTNSSADSCVISGTNGDGCWLGKVNSTGGLEWSQTYPFASTEAVMAQTNDGGYAIAGYSVATSSSNNVFLIKTDSSGNMQWNRTLVIRSLGGFQVSSLIATNDGGYALAGVNVSSSTNVAALIKTDSYGNVLWSQTYGELVQIDVIPVMQAIDGGYALGVNGNLIETDSYGKIQWSLAFNMPVYSVVQTDNGSFVVAGSSNIANGWLAKTTSSPPTVTPLLTPTSPPISSPTPTESPTASPTPTTSPLPSIPEFPSFIFFPILLSAMLAGTIIYRREN